MSAEYADELEKFSQWDAPACQCDCWVCRHAEAESGEHCHRCEEPKDENNKGATMTGYDYKTGHVYQLAANGSGEVHDDSCQHPEHGSQPFTIAVPADNATFDADTVRRMTDAEVQHHDPDDPRNKPMSPFATVLVDSCRSMNKKLLESPLSGTILDATVSALRDPQQFVVTELTADVERRKRQLLQGMADLLDDFCADIEARAIRQHAPEPPAHTTPVLSAEEIMDRQRAGINYPEGFKEWAFDEVADEEDE